MRQSLKVILTLCTLFACSSNKPTNTIETKPCQVKVDSFIYPSTITYLDAVRNRNCIWEGEPTKLELYYNHLEGVKLDRLYKDSNFVCYRFDANVIIIEDLKHEIRLAFLKRTDKIHYDSIGISAIFLLNEIGLPQASIFYHFLKKTNTIEVYRYDEKQADGLYSIPIELDKTYYLRGLDYPDIMELSNRINEKKYKETENVHRYGSRALLIFPMLSK